MVLLAKSFVEIGCSMLAGKKAFLFVASSTVADSEAPSAAAAARGLGLRRAHQGGGGGGLRRSQADWSHVCFLTSKILCSRTS